MSLAPCVFIDANGSAELSGAAATAPFKGPAKHGALAESIATSEFFARTTPNELLSHLGVDALSPLRTPAKGLALRPRPVRASGLSKRRQMQPHHDRLVRHA